MRASQKRFQDVQCNEEHIHETICKSLEAYRAYETRNNLNWSEFLFQQGQYIQKRWWLLQGLLLAMLWWMLQFVKYIPDIQRAVGVLAPTFAMLVIPELWKNQRENAMEVECTARYSLRQIYTARMTWFGFIDMILLSVFLLSASQIEKLPLWDLIIQFFVPMNVTCCILLRTLCSNRIRSQIFALFLCLVWTALWTLIVLGSDMFSLIAVPIWWLLLIGSTIYLVCCAVKVQRSCEKLWEELPIWN